LLVSALKGQFVLACFAPQELHGPAVALLGMFLESLGLPGAELLEVFEQDAAVGQEVFHPLGIGQRQVAFEDQALGAEQGCRDLVLVLL
jgi:hypothetical protein